MTSTTSMTSIKTPADSNITALNDMMQFLHFAHDPKPGYQGTVVFRINMPDGTEQLRSIDVHPQNGVKIYTTLPPHGKVSCECTCSSKTFFDIYENKLHPRSAVMSGQLKVHGFAFRELGRFGASFDTRTEKWNEYYAHLKKLEAAAGAAAAAGVAAATTALANNATNLSSIATNKPAPSVASTATSITSTSTQTSHPPRIFTKSFWQNLFTKIQEPSTLTASAQTTTTAVKPTNIQGAARIVRDQAVNWLFRGVFSAAQREQRALARVSQLAHIARNQLRTNGPSIQSLAVAVSTALFLEMSPFSPSQATTTSNHVTSTPKMSSGSSKDMTSPRLSPKHLALPQSQIDFIPNDLLFAHPSSTPVSATATPGETTTFTLPAPWQMSAAQVSSNSSSGHGNGSALALLTEGMPAALKEEIIASATLPPRTPTKSASAVASVSPSTSASSSSTQYLYATPQVTKIANRDASRSGLLSWLSGKKQKYAAELEQARSEARNALAKSFTHRMAYYLSSTASDLFVETTDLSTTTTATGPISTPGLAVVPLPGLRQPLVGTPSLYDDPVHRSFAEGVRARGRGTPARLRATEASQAVSSTTTVAPADVSQIDANTDIATNHISITKVFPSLSLSALMPRFKREGHYDHTDLIRDSGGY